MTENQAIKIIKQEKQWESNARICDAFETSIKALEEIQQYRAIGTVEQLKTMFDGFWKLKDLCEEYEKYGLPEDYWKLNEMCKEYSAIGTIEEFKAMKEKSVAKKPAKAGIGYKCVCCGSYTDPRDWHSAYCGRCGQKMDWNVGKEDAVQNIGYADQSGLMSAT